MRIIAGLAKGRNLLSPVGATRPTSDRAREALFSSLESEFGTLSDLYFLDLYCGSGAIAAEALSRGAALVHAVDNSDKATDIARKNLEMMSEISGIGTSHVFTMSVGKYLDADHNRMVANISFDIVFMDPPYELPNSDVEKIVRDLLAQKIVKPSSIIAIERESKSRAPEWPEGLRLKKERKYGAATIYYAEPTGAL